MWRQKVDGFGNSFKKGQSYLLTSYREEEEYEAGLKEKILLSPQLDMACMLLVVAVIRNITLEYNSI